MKPLTLLLVFTGCFVMADETPRIEPPVMPGLNVYQIFGGWKALPEMKIKHYGGSHWHGYLVAGFHEGEYTAWGNDNGEVRKLSAFINYYGEGEPLPDFNQTFFLNLAANALPEKEFRQFEKWLPLHYSKRGSESFIILDGKRFLLSTVDPRVMFLEIQMAPKVYTPETGYFGAASGDLELHWGEPVSRLSPAWHAGADFSSVWEIDGLRLVGSFREDRLVSLSVGKPNRQHLHPTEAAAILKRYAAAGSGHEARPDLITFHAQR